MSLLIACGLALGVMPHSASAAPAPTPQVLPMSGGTSRTSCVGMHEPIYFIHRAVDVYWLCAAIEAVPSNGNVLIEVGFVVSPAANVYTQGVVQVTVLDAIACRERIFTSPEGVASGAQPWSSTVATPFVGADPLLVTIRYVPAPGQPGVPEGQAIVFRTHT
jgi:hypothetical protein